MPDLATIPNSCSTQKASFVASKSIIKPSIFFSAYGASFLINISDRCEHAKAAQFVIGKPLWPRCISRDSTCADLEQNFTKKTEADWRQRCASSTSAIQIPYPVMPKKSVHFWVVFWILWINRATSKILDDICFVLHSNISPDLWIKRGRNLWAWLCIEVMNYLENSWEVWTKSISCPSSTKSFCLFSRIFASCKKTWELHHLFSRFQHGDCIFQKVFRDMCFILLQERLAIIDHRWAGAWNGIKRSWELPPPLGWTLWIDLAF